MGTTNLSDLTLDGALAVGGAATVTGALAVTGATTLTGALTASDDISIANGKQIKPDGGTATATAGAATLSKQAGKVTSESLTTAAAASYTLTLTNTLVAATSLVFASVALGTSTAGTPQIVSVTPGAGSVVIVVKNIHGTNAFNGTITVDFLVLNTV